MTSLALAGGFGPVPTTGYTTLESVANPAVQQASLSVVDLGTATGFVASADGFVVTNAHVARSLGDQVLARMSVSRQLVVLDLVEVRPDLDIALYQIEEDAQPWLAIRRFGPTRNEAVAVLGHPAGRDLQVSFGRVLTADAEVSETPSVEYSAQTWWGSSGSPVIDPSGRAMAVHWGWDAHRKYHGRMLGVPMDVAVDEMGLLASIADCPNPGTDLSIRAVPLQRQGRHVLALIALEGPSRCLDQVQSVTWHLHPTLDDPDVLSLDPDDGFALLMRVGGMFPLSATVEFDRRTAEVAGDLSWPTNNVSRADGKKR